MRLQAAAPEVLLLCFARGCCHGPAMLPQDAPRLVALPGPSQPKGQNPPPSAPFPVLRRQRLISRLHELVHHRLTMVVAPAGYGKTTLLTDFATDCAAGSLPITVCWYTASPWEIDAPALLGGLTQAVRSRVPSFGDGTLRLLSQAPPGRTSADAERFLAAAAATLAHELAQQVDDYTLLVLDDYQQLDEAPLVRRALELLLDQLPGHVHLVLLSRTVPALDTSRLLLAGQVAALGPPELAFNQDELALFLRQRYLLAPEPELLEEVHRRTEGWIAGLVLAMPTPTAGPPSVRAAALVTALQQAWNGGERLHEYLALHLFRQQDEVDRALLAAAALPESCTPEELDRVLDRSDSGERLTALQRAGIPIGPTGGETGRYRLHALIRQFLCAYLERTDRVGYAQLRHRWAEQALASGDTAAALTHFLASGLHERAAKVLERIGEQWIDMGRRQVVEAWLAQLPPPMIRRRPRVGLVLGRLALTRGSYDQAVEVARQAGFAAQRARDSVAAGRALLLEAMATVAAGRAEAGLQLCAQALAQRIVRRHKPLLAEAYRSLSIAETIRGLLAPALEHMEQALALYERAGQTWDVALALNNLGVLREQRGQVDQARWCHTRALALHRELGDLLGMARSLNNLGLLHLYSGAFSEAEASFTEALSLADRTSNLRSRAAAHVNLGDLRRVQQRPQEALDCYRKAEDAARAAVDPRWGAYARIGKAAAHLALENAAEAEREARQAAGEAEREGLLEVGGHARATLAAALLVARRTREASALLEAARQAARETGSKALQARAYLWSGYAAYQQKRWGEALACLHVATEAAEASGGPTVLALEGRTVVPLLRLAASRGVESSHLAGALDLLDSSSAAAVREAMAVPPTAPAALLPLTLRLLGPFAGTIGKRPIEASVAPRSRVGELLAYLVAHPEGRRREEIGADLWPDAEAGQDVTLTYTTLHRLRQALFQEVVATDSSLPGGYTLNPLVPLKVDVWQFEQLLRTAEAPSTSTDDRRCALEEAVSLYRGPFFTECYADWAMVIRQRLERRYLRALAQLVDLEWKEEHYRACLRWCERLLESDQAEVAVHCRVLECHERLSEPLAGLLHYRRYASELGTEPAGPLTARLATLVQRLEGALGSA